MDKKRTIGAGAFKQTCLALLDEVAREHTEIIVTKRGKPVARLVPLPSSQEHEENILGALRGRGRTLVSDNDFCGPTISLAGWKVD